MDEVMETQTVRIKKLHDAAILPAYAHGPLEDAGMDLFAIEEVILSPGVPTAVRTGISIELPPGFEAQVRARGGLALKHGIQVVNGPGTCDPAYRGEIKVILVWGGYEPNAINYLGVAVSCEEYVSEVLRYPNAWGELDPAQVNHNIECSRRHHGRYRISPGQKIAQLVIARYIGVTWEESTEELTTTSRGAGGFGSTGA